MLGDRTSKLVRASAITGTACDEILGRLDHRIEGGELLWSGVKTESPPSRSTRRKTFWRNRLTNEPRKFCTWEENSKVEAFFFILEEGGEE